MKKIIIYFSLVITIFTLTQYSLAKEVKHVHFDDELSAGGHFLKLRGEGILKWLIFDVYITALYLPPDVSEEQVLDDVPKKMVYHFLRDMKAEQFAQSGEALLLKNASEEELKNISEELDAIHYLYRDITKGERYSLTYMPGKGTELAMNDEVLGLVEGYEFASVYFRIWLGANPVSENLKYKLLHKGKKPKTPEMDP